MALVSVRRPPRVLTTKSTDDIQKCGDIENKVETLISKSLNECYFANFSAAMAGCGRAARRSSGSRAPPDIQHHLQAMFGLLRPEETLKMAVKLESGHLGRTRYLVVVCRGEEAALLGIDCNARTTVGLVLRVLADTTIKLDGDGGFSVCVCNQQHIFKPVSVQAMWSALQTLHRASGRARSLNHFWGGASHGWCAYYEARVDSDRSCLNEWHAMDSLESRRPPSPNSLRLKPRERDETERVIRCTLKEIMMSVDLDEVTSKVIRVRLEEELDMDLGEYKSFIDQEMLTILGQMDAPTEVFDHVYLGSEWNASNLEELQRNGVRHILNVTREIDNFFPGVFNYLNIRVYDDDKTDLLKHWDNTYKYITKARSEGSKVLVHCKMGISRSASVVIAYAMKAYNWNFDKAWRHVKNKRNCIKPNNNFLNQLETYQGILDAMKNKEKLQRSKSETNLKLSKNTSKTESKTSNPTPMMLALSGSLRGRPRSWSPDTKVESEILPPTSMSLENLASETRHMLMPCANGCYSVSPNQIMRLKEDGAPSVKHIVNEIESATTGDRREGNRKSQRLSFSCQTDTTFHRFSDLSMTSSYVQSADLNVRHSLPHRCASHKCLHLFSDSEQIHTWDPGEMAWYKSDNVKNDNVVKSDSGIVDLKSKTSDMLTLYNLERNLECDSRRSIEDDIPPPSRQSSWSSFDSAVVPDLSRHSSWGSYDTRSMKGQVLVREDSIKRLKEKSDDKINKKEERLEATKSTDLSSIREHTESRSTSKKFPLRSNISDNVKKFNETCAILKELANAAARIESAKERGSSTWCGSVGGCLADRVASGAGGGALRRRRALCASQGDLPRTQPLPPAPGFVSNLKKEFEARSREASSAGTEERDKNPSPSAPEDLSVKKLVGRYDQPGRSRSTSESSKGKAQESVPKKCRLSGEGSTRARRVCSALRNSFCGAVRPPVAPHVLSLAPIDCPNLVSTVMSKAQNKKQLQHGKTHPLTKLNPDRQTNRCSNSVYNTM